MTARRGIRNVVAESRLIRWWTLKNLSQASELALKLLAAVAAVGALNFFTLKPAVSWGHRCTDGIDIRELQSIYRSHDRRVPRPVRDAADGYNIRGEFPLPDELAGEFSSLAPIPTVGCSRLAAADPDVHGRALPVLEREYPQGKVEGYPYYALVLASRPTMTLKDLRFAVRALDRARYIDIVLVVSNEGEAPARQVQVSYPLEFQTVRGDGTFDLPPGGREALVLRPEEIRFYYKIEEVKVAFESSSLVDIALLGWIAVGLMAVAWLLPVVREVLREPRPSKERREND